VKLELRQSVYSTFERIKSNKKSMPFPSASINSRRKDIKRYRMFPWGKITVYFY